jgi:hypothetical protein
MYLIPGSLVWAAAADVATADAKPAEVKQDTKPQPQKLYSETISNVLGDAEKAFKIAAIVLAGIWTYLNFFRGRTYRPRLEPKISGSTTFSNDAISLVATVDLKNVGLSKVSIRKEGSALLVFVAEVPSDLSDAQEIGWDRMAVFDIFKNHRWIEPGEVIQEQRLIVVPNGNFQAFRLDVRIVSENRLEWNATAILTSTRVLKENPAGDQI